MNMEYNFSEDLKSIREILGFSQSELAEKIGTSRQNLTNKFKRDNFSEKEILQIAQALDCTFEGTLILNDSGEVI